MNIKITDNLYLRSDTYCCWLAEIKTVAKGKNKGQQYEESIGYYRDPQQAFIELLQHKIRTSEAQNLSELITLVKEHNDFVKQLVKDTRDLYKEETK